ncbi:homoserine dehydrogenase, partial [Bacillus pumilus]
QDHQDKLMHQIGCPVLIQKVRVSNPDKKRDVDVAREVFTTEVYDVMRDPEVDVIIEVMGCIEETKQYLRDALNEKKHVITA